MIQWVVLFQKLFCNNVLSIMSINKRDQKVAQTNITLEKKTEPNKTTTYHANTTEKLNKPKTTYQQTLLKT